MVDLHSHLLPGVDDGSRSVEQSLRVLAQMEAHGVTDICLTPHLSVADLEPVRLGRRLAEHADALSGLNALKTRMPRLHTGVELMLDESIQGVKTLDRRLSLGGSRYVLVEFPRVLTASAIRGLIVQITQLGLVPLVAHPERYAVASEDELYAWRDLGAVIQVDATTLVVNKGPRGARARAYIEAGLADILAGDNHGDQRMISDAENYLRRRGALVQSDYLLTLNPAAILRDRALEAVPPVRLVRGWKATLRRLIPGLNNP